MSLNFKYCSPVGFNGFSFPKSFLLLRILFFHISPQFSCHLFDFLDLCFAPPILCLKKARHTSMSKTPLLKHLRHQQSSEPLRLSFQILMSLMSCFRCSVRASKKHDMGKVCTIERGCEIFHSHHYIPFQLRSPVPPNGGLYHMD